MNKIKYLVLTAIGLLCSLSVSAEDFEVDGIYYNITSSTDMTVKVTYRGSYSSSYSDEYSGAVTIPESVTYNGNTYSVTSIGDYAFSGCSSLTSVVIPNSVTSIGYEAFKGTAWYNNQPDGVVYLDNYLLGYKGTMPSNTSIVIKDSTLLIADYAFSRCSGLTSVMIPNSVTSIGMGAFYCCSGLTSVEIPNSVTSIGYETFSYCSGLTSVVIGNGVTSIGRVAFERCSGLTSVEIPNSVTSIGYEAFKGCSGLTSVEIPNSVTSINDYAFRDCSGLTSVEIGNSVTSIGQWVFQGTAWYNNQPNGVVYLDNYLLCYKGTMRYNTSVKIKEGTLLIADLAFKGCSGLTSVEIPNSATSIGGHAFSGCSNLTSMVIPNSVTSIGARAFYECSRLTSVEIPNSVTSIGNSAFSGCSGLTSVVIPNSVTSIWGYAFEGCSGLTSVEIPNSVTSIGEWAFSDCSGLTSVVIPNSVTSIGDGAFRNCSGLTSVVIPNSVTSIGVAAFYGCSGLTSVEIPNSVTSIGDAAFSTNLSSIIVDENNAYYDSRGNCNAIIETASNTLISGCKNTIIPSSVFSIGSSAFEGCSDLTSMEIPNSVTSIGIRAFSECSRLTSVEIPNSVTSIGEWAFSNCSGLTSVVIGYSVTNIGNYAFYNCNNLKSVTSLNPTPPATSSSPFSNYDATLYVPFGAKTAYSKANNWKNFTNIEELEPSIYEITDGEEYTEASVKTVNALTYTRTLPNLHWNALYVPFELPYDVIADRYDVAYINDVNGYDTDENGEIDDLAMEIIRIKGGTLKANYPYLIKAKTEADKAVSITVEDATLYAAEENAVDCSSVYQSYVVKGTYTKKTAEELAGKLAISTSGAWQPLAEGTALNPFRLYLSIENRDNSPLKVESAAMSHMRIVERGETTGIEEVVPSQQREDVIFDVSGRRVKQAVKGGVYIINGKKRIL